MKFWAKNKKGFAEGSHSVGHRAFFVKFLCILLCLITCIGLPSTVQAAEYDPSDIEIDFYHVGDLVYDNNVGSIPYGVNTTASINDIYHLGITITADIKCSAGDVVNVLVKQTYNRYAYSFTPGWSFGCKDTNGKTLLITDGKCIYENYQFKIIDVTIPRDCTIKSINFGFDPRSIQYKDWNNSKICGIGFSSCKVTVETEQSSFFDKVGDFFNQLFEDLKAWFNTLFEWLRDIRDNAVQLGNNLKSWFSDLSNNIKGFFTELSNNIKSFFSDLTKSIKEQFTNMINNLKTFFADVGQWFKDIGDRIGQFFTNLWNNISNTINGITADIRAWWQGVVDFFYSLFVPEDGYFDKYKQDWEDWARLHFALFYDVMDFVDLIFEALPAGLEDMKQLTITIPEMKLPVLDKFVFIQETSVELGALYNSHTAFKYFYDLYRVCFSAFCYFLLIKYLQRTLSEVITGDGDTL